MKNILLLGVLLSLTGCVTGLTKANANKGYTGIGLVAYYPFNGNAKDESGNGFDGRVIGAKLTTDRHGNANSAYEFDGKLSAIEIFRGGELVTQDTIIISAWIYPTAETLSKKGQSTIFTQNDSTAGFVTHQVRLRGKKLEYDNWNPNYGWTASKQNIEPNKWSHIIVARKGDNVSLYVNGVLSSRGKGERRLSAASIDNILIGARHYKRSRRDAFQGKIDDVRIYNTALQDDKIAALFTGSSTVTSARTGNAVQPQVSNGNNQIRMAGYWSMNRNTVTRGNLLPTRHGFNGKAVNTSIDEKGVSKESVYFDGLSSHVDFGDSLDNLFAGPGKSFTVSMWIKPADHKEYSVLLSKNADTSCSNTQNQRQFGIGLYYSKPRFYYQSATGRQFVSVQSKWRVRTNIWSHLAITYNGSINSSAQDRVQIYKDGRRVELAKTKKRGAFPFDLQDSAAHLSLGEHIDGRGQPCKRKLNDAFNGSIDDVAIWKGVLPADKISAIAAKGKNKLALLESAVMNVAEQSTNICCDLSGDYTYSGRGLVRIDQSGKDIHMFLTWAPRGRGPHYEVKGTLVGNTIIGKWYSHYKKQGWFDFKGIVSPSSKIIDFSETSDPIGSNINKVMLINNTLISGSGIDFIKSSSVDSYMRNQETQLRRKLDGTGIDVVRGKKHIVLKLPNNITFDTDSDVLKSKFEPILKSITAVLKQYNSTLVTTIGHTDNVGAIEHNQKLSEKRARSLSTYLTNNGINQNRLSSIGKGQFQPVATNDTSSGRARNRRVEIMLEPLHN